MPHAIMASRYFIKEALILPLIQALSTSVQLSDKRRLITETIGDMKAALMYHITKRHYITVLYMIHTPTNTNKSMFDQMNSHIICLCLLITATIYIVINYSIYSIYTAKRVGVILVAFLLSYSLYLFLPQTYTAYLELYGLHLELYEFHLGLYRNPCI